MDLAEKKKHNEQRLKPSERMEVERSTQVDDDERGELKKKLFIKYWKFKFLFHNFSFGHFLCCSRCSTLGFAFFARCWFFSLVYFQCSVFNALYILFNSEWDEKRRASNLWAIEKLISLSNNTQIWQYEESSMALNGTGGLECCCRRRRRRRLRAYRTITTENYSLKLELSFAAAALRSLEC